jgi:hypothetical protein
MNRKTRLALELVVLAGLITCLVFVSLARNRPRGPVTTLTSAELLAIIRANKDFPFDPLTADPVARRSRWEWKGRLVEHCILVDVDGPSDTSQKFHAHARVAIDEDKREAVAWILDM